MSPSRTLNFFASCPRQLEPLLADELKALNAENVRQVTSGVQFAGDLETAYKACLWSRVANRILLPLGAGPASSPEQLYSFVQTFDWSEHLAAAQTLAVDFFCAKSQITHSQYGALKVKDAVVDQFRERVGSRPSVDRATPDVRINVYLFRDRARVAIDLSGASLHRRGYRLDGSRAPLKENLAASLLLAAGWSKLASNGQSFCDPMCGSGTLLIEAAMIASNTAPGLLRDYYGFTGWRQHQSELWQRLVSEAESNAQAGRQRLPTIVGSDSSEEAIVVSQNNIRHAGFEGLIDVKCADVTNVDLPDAIVPGLVLSNPPYGIRVEEQAELGHVYSDLGLGIKRHFSGWQVALFSGAHKLLYRTRLPLESILEVDNGGIACKLASALIHDTRIPDTSPHNASVWDTATKNIAAKKSAGTPVVADNMFANRLRKNLAKFKSWVKREKISAYRVYDADMPEYAVAIDIYDTDDQRHVVVQEYQAPSSVDERRAADRLELIINTIPGVLGCDPEAVHLRIRKRQKGSDQYTRTSVKRNEYSVFEYGCQLLVNFDDYLDTGLFPDHRIVRHHIQSVSEGKRFLNLFAYTAAATVHAIRGGAAGSLTIDMSNTYLEWAKRNIVLNDGDPSVHPLIRHDCIEWLANATDRGSFTPGDEGLFDLILLDPPTFSNSARMTQDWDVQRDHSTLIRHVMGLLAPRGKLIFSTNFRRFKLDISGLSDFALEDKSAWSLDRDFQRNSRIHQCWFIFHK